MATAKTTIELNGKLYDARTGKIISESENIVPKKTSASSTAVSLDGVSRHPGQAAAALAPKPTVARTAPLPVHPKLEKSKTLMRPAVKKPQPAGQSSHAVSGKQEHFKKHDPLRQARASTTPRSAHIQRFGASHNQHKIIKKAAPLTVASQSVSSHHITGQIAHLATSTEAHVKQSVDLIEESLRHASAHLQTFEDKALKGSFLQRTGFKNKAANLASMSLATVLLVGFFAYQNAPNIEMRMAAARSGVSASMPGYKPAGFSTVRGIQSEPGKVTVAFQSNTSEKNFNITQQASNWSSDSLLNNHVIASNMPYQTYQDEGKTVYVYNNSNATWVNSGVWYQIKGDASLTSDQLLRIANSL